MKLVTFTADDYTRVGAIDGHSVIDLTSVTRDSADAPHFTSMRALLEAGKAGMEAADAAIKAAGNMYRLPLADVKLEAPVPNPGALYCIACNFREHIEEFGDDVVKQDEETPRFFMKPPVNTVVGPGDAIKIPPVACSMDWEGELAVVIGTKAKGVSAEDALDYVAGYTIMNDVSERKLKVWDRTNSRPKDLWFDWLNGKWLDTSAPQGPALVTADEIPDPQSLQITTRINGETKQSNTTAQMIFSVARLIEYVSTFLTLHPGDLISTGTIAGVGASSGTFLKDGDDVEIEISNIGILKNPVEKSDS